MAWKSCTNCDGVGGWDITDDDERNRLAYLLTLCYTIKDLKSEE